VPDINEILGLAEIIERTAMYTSKERSLYAALVSGCMEYRGYRMSAVHEIASRASSGEYTIEELISRLEEVFPRRGKVLRLLLLSRIDLEELSRNIRELHIMLLGDAIIARRLVASLKEMHRRALVLLLLLTTSSMGLLKIRAMLAGASMLAITPEVPWYVLAAATLANIIVLSRLCQLSIVKSLIATALGAVIGYVVFWVIL